MKIFTSTNFKRKRFLKCLDYEIKGELAILYKDRLCRFGYEIVEYLITTYSEGRIILINKAKEITEDIYILKINGLRKYKREINR